MQATETVERGKRAGHLSKDGFWRSFPKVPCLLQYVRTGNYYARVRVNGKLIRRRLETDIWSTAKLRLSDAVKEYRRPKEEKPILTVKEAWDMLLHEIAHDLSIKESSRSYKGSCLQKLERSWPGLKEKPLAEVGVQECREWAETLSNEIASQYRANVISILRRRCDSFRIRPRNRRQQRSFDLKTVNGEGRFFNRGTRSLIVQIGVTASNVCSRNAVSMSTVHMRVLDF